MKTSELIDKLNKIAKTVPFDAEIVTGDDWLWQGVDKVYHNPPHTYIQFDSYEENEWGEDEENRRRASITELATRAHMIEQVIEMIEATPDHSKEKIISELGGWAAKMQSMADALKKQ
ncbi:hypothetical protein [Serratia sp. P2ACOL2]|uniref:hypothetical protein n=1 Tax=Serratia sp. P2ACOL2 TaxID=2482769 RepID=UPI000EFBFB23|nr:hypothetical protein [Serratia sp. P2ACOL2]AYO37242.1 hypothetical protein EBA31_07995 [Serratia sp. P2ACOL2]